MKKYYHGTTKENAKKILANGFKKSYGRFGEGVYLTPNKQNAKVFAREFGVLIECEYLGDIAIIDYKKINNIIPNCNVSIEEEEGFTDLPTHIERLGYDGALIVYDEEKNDSELVVYNTKWIQSITT